jgi:Ni/Co efflux regulator RcnB
MKKLLLAAATGVMLFGTAGAAFAQDRYDGYDYGTRSSYDLDDGRYDDRYDDRNDSRYDDRNDDRYDDRNDGRYDTRNDGRDDSRYDNRAYGRSGQRVRDRDCDGIPDSQDRHSSRNVHDRDCDGIINRFDRRDGRAHQARRQYDGPRYYAPRNYRETRYTYGHQLPTGYWGNNYYIDYQPYGLSQPPSGYRWNRVGDDVYLVSVRNGLIAEAVYSLFR